MTEKKHHTDPVVTKEESTILQAFSPSKIILPTIIGIAAVLWLMYKQVDIEAVKEIKWTSHVTFWIGIAIVLLIIRHLSYAARLKTLADGHFSWWKSIELIFIWEFSSSVSPTSLGGSVVAFFMLAQEKLSAAKTATIVIYTIILDSLFFLIGMPLLYIIFGANSIRPDVFTFSELGGWSWTVITLYLLMAGYASFFFYGLFLNPRRLKQLMLFFTKNKFLRRWRQDANKLGDDIILTSSEVRHKPLNYHLKLFLLSATPWICRFLLLNALIIAFVESTSLDFMTQLLLYGRSKFMFMIMAFSPTPGSSGLAELVFGGFLSDFVPEGISLIIALIWRLLTYYVYLIVGVIIIPNWIRKVMIRRRKNKLKTIGN